MPRSVVESHTARVIFVAGMHRSGTSFVAELVHLLGAAVGDDLLEPAADNPHGFWESKQVKRINDDLLRRLGGSWDRPPRPLTSGWFQSPGLDRLRHESQDLVSEMLACAGEAPALVLKDPRFSLTAPFWTSFLSPHASLVLVRNPQLVAESLRYRNGMTVGRAASLWIEYTLGALSHLPNAEIVRLDDLTARPVDGVERLAMLVGLEGSVETAAEVAVGRSRTLETAKIFSIEETDEHLALALAIYELLSGIEDLDAARPAMAHLHEGWALSSLEAIAQDHSHQPLRSEIEGLQARLALALRQVEDERLTTSDARQERDQIRRQQRVTAKELEQTREQLTANADVLRREVESTKQELLAATRARDDALHERDNAIRERENAIQRTESEQEQRRLAERQLEETRNELGAARRNRERQELSNRQLAASVRKAESDRRQMARRAQTAERRFNQLKSRRSVRQALRLAGVFRPAFRSIRTMRRAVGGTEKRQGESGDGSSKGEVVSRDSSSPDPGDVGDVSASRGQRETLEEPTAVLPGPTERAWTPIVARLIQAPEVTVIVPIHNAADETERCLESLQLWTPERTDILLIDDASTDPQISTIIGRFQDERRSVRVIRIAENQGFTRTVNRGFASCGGDALILNSDARVGPNWLTNLRMAAYSGDRVASASATSDNAGAFSVPNPGHNTPNGLDDTSVSRLYAQRSVRLWCSAPTGHGFCMYLRRDALDEVGDFDASLFPRGYGEENDWSMRALAKGWSHVVDDATMVFHSDASSFGPVAKTELVAEARSRINSLHPDYTDRVRAFMSEELVPVREQAAAIDDLATSLATTTSSEAHVRPRLLSVVQAGGGGTPQTNLDLMRALEEDWDPYVLTSDGKSQCLFRIVGGQRILIEESTSALPLGFNQESDTRYREFLARTVLGLGIELVHVRHLFKHTPRDLPDVLRAAGIPAVLSFHDFFWVCPTVNLLDQDNTFCGGRCTSTPGDCSAPVPGSAFRTRLKHAGVERWRSMTREVLESFDEFVTTSTVARDILYGHYPELEQVGIEVIPHGRDVSDHESLSAPPDRRQITIAVIGNLSTSKGGGFLRSLLDADVDQRLDVHIIGGCDRAFEDLRCTFHGPYSRDDLGAMIEKIRPAFAGLLSIASETWSHTLTEAWSFGIPALVLEGSGALSERVAEHGGGWVLDVHQVDAAYREILRIVESDGAWQKQASLASVDHLTSTSEMADGYRSLYASAHRRRTRTLRTLVDVHTVVSKEGRSPGTAHVRSLRRFAHPSVRHGLLAMHRSSARPAGIGRPDVIWVQRNAVAQDDVAGLLRDRRRWGSRLVVDLDDDLLDPEGLPPDLANYTHTIKELISTADLVTVSTAALAEVVRNWTANVALLPNQLDETMWGLDPPPPRHGSECLDVLYMGTATHDEDLQLLREPLELYNADADHPVRLHVIGVTQTESNWYHRIPVPNESKEYPAFVAWLQSVSLDFDFAVAPLRDTPFNRSKSDLKFLEYAALGLPAIFSHSTAYGDAVESGTNGLITQNSPAAWADALGQMAAQDVRERLRAGALGAARDRTIGRTAEDFIRLVRGTDI